MNEFLRKKYGSWTWVFDDLCGKGAIDWISQIIEQRQMGRNSMETYRCERKDLGMVHVAQSWARLSFEVDMFIKLKLETSSSGIHLYKRLVYWMGHWKFFQFPDTVTLISKPRSGKTDENYASHTHVGYNVSAMLRVQLVTANSSCSGAQYHAEVTLHTSGQNCGTVWQREVDSWKNPGEGNEEERVISTIYFLLEDFYLFAFCLPPPPAIV